MLKSDPELYWKVFAGDILAVDPADLVTAVVVARVVSSDHLEVPVHHTYSVYLDKHRNTNFHKSSKWICGQQRC